MMGRFMCEKGYVPACVLCSTAKRARETLSLVLTALDAEPPVHYRRTLYLAEWLRLLDAIHAAPWEAMPLLLIGHNPGMEQLALALAAPPKSAVARARAKAMAQKFPTAALAVLGFRNADWRAVRPGTGNLADFVRPKDIAKDESAGAD